ncbi:hypothetical protein [Plantactinospora sp. CA-290183]|uniref:hypothetical protein n=1 Tax=Plantactinospora sp. CA-290183 TaxID=3240006 RepID=UPI003D929A4D
MRRRWSLAPGAVAAGRDITGTVVTGPMYVQVLAGRFDRVHDAIFDPTPLAEQLDVARFVGRTGLIARIDECVAGQDRGYVVIRGEAGVGKSALAAHLVWTRPCVFHFTRLDGGARSPVEARKSLAAQLIGGWGLAERFTPGDVFPVAADRPDWLAKVLRAAAAERDRQRAKQPLVLVVDGLDEAQPDPPGMGTGVPLGLPTPDSLPAGVYIVATSRYGLPLAALKDPQRVRWSQITVEGPDNLADMRTYLHTVLEGPNPDHALVTALQRDQVTVDRFIGTLMDRCRGVWIYLRYVLDDIRSGRCPATHIAALPDRLHGYYLQQIERWTTNPQAWQRVYRPSLAALAALQRAVTSDELAHILTARRSDLDTTEPVTAEQIAAWLDGPARAFLNVIRSPDRSRLYAVRHQSLRDLFSPDVTRDHDDEDDPVEAGMNVQLHAAWTTAHQAITSWLTPAAVNGRRAWTSVDDYTRLMLPAHAAAAGLLDPLMTDPVFMLASPPDQILRHRHTLTAADAIAAARALEMATNEWATRPDDDPRWWLHVWARRIRATPLAENLAEQAPHWPCTVQAGFWTGTTHRTLTCDSNDVSAVAALPRPDGRTLIISGSSDGTVRVWDPDSGTQMHELTGHSAAVSAVAALPRPDGRTLVISGDDEGRVRVWDPDSGTQIHRLTGHAKWVLAVAALPRPDGRTLIISGDYEGTVRVWDPDSGTQIHKLTSHRWVSALVVLPRPDGRTLIISGDNRGTVWVWDSDSGTQIHRLIGHTRRVSALVALPRPDGTTLIVSGGDGTVRVWDPDSGRQIHRLTGHTAAVRSVAVMPRPGGASLIVSGGGQSDGTVRVWDPDSGTQIHELTGHTAAVLAVAALPRPDGRTLIVSGGGRGDGTVRVWDPDSQTYGLNGHTDWVSAVAALPCPDGRTLIISGSNDRTVRVWDPDSGTQIHKLTGHTDWVSAVAALPCPDGRTLIISGGKDRTVRVWDPDSGTQIHELTGHIGWVSAVAALPCPDGRALIVSGSNDRIVRVWDPDSGTQIHELTGHTAAVLAVAASARPDGRTLVISGDDEGTVWVWDPDSGTQIHMLTGHTAAVRSVAAVSCADGRTLVMSGDDEGTVWVWDPDSGTRIHKLTGHTAVRSVAALSRPDGQTLVISGGREGTVRVWDPDSGTQIHELTGHTAAVRSVAALSRPDGRTLIISGSDDRAVLVWALRSERASKKMAARK